MPKTLRNPNDLLHPACPQQLAAYHVLATGVLVQIHATAIQLLHLSVDMLVSKCTLTNPSHV